MKKNKLERIVIIVVAGLIVHIPFAFITTIVYLGLIKLIGVNMDIALMFLIWLNYYSIDTDRKAQAVWDEE